MKIIFLLLGILFSIFSSNLQAQTAITGTNTNQWTQLPYDRMIKPAGNLIIMGDSTHESHALDASLSPDKKWLAVEERYSIVFINTLNNEIQFTLPLNNIPGLHNAMCTYSGIYWYRKNAQLFILVSVANRNGNSYVVKLYWDGKTATAKHIFNYRAVPPARLALPNEILVSREANHDYLYVVLNGNNQLIKQDLLTGDTIWLKNTGIAPYGITIAQKKLYITNWAGPVPKKSDKNVAGVPWGIAKVDASTAACNEGSVNIYDPRSGNLLKELVVGLHPCKIISSTDEKFVYLSNSNSDMVSVINTKTDKISESIPLHIQTDFNNYLGAMPNSLAVSSNGKTLYVANGMDNAIAVIPLGNKASSRGKREKSNISGFIPTAAFPSSISISGGKTLYVTNLESFGANTPYSFIPNHAPVYNAHHMMASVSVINIPRKKQLAGYTKTVIAGNQLERLKSVQLDPRPNTPPKPVPDRIGEPSVFKHVLYIIKENRTYDQVLGDVSKGNGDPTLCIFGKEVTPNTHILVDQFQLMDNFFVSGKCSAEGHLWTDASIVTDYIEKNVRAWFRSYTHVLNDALAYPATGFLWDNARKHGLSVRIYGEAATPVFNDTLTWNDVYSGFKRGKPFNFTNKTTLSTVRRLLSANYPGYDGHKIPDVLRAKSFITELNHYASMEGDALPQLMIMALPNDHTSGTRPGFPTPRAMVADNDLALGQIIEAISHSRFWKNTVVFVLEDDSQSGWDHVSAYRTVAMVVSPYSKLKKPMHTAYNQPSMIRTIEQILGLPPMNIQDAIAKPMTECFNDVPDYSPYISVKNQIPLNEMNPPLSALSGKPLHFANLSLDPQFDGIDTGNDELFNHILWFSAMGNISYPLKYSGKDDD